MNNQKHYNRLMEFWNDAPTYPLRPDDKYCIFGDSHFGIRDGADDFQSQHDITINKFSDLVHNGFKFIPNGDIIELLECKSLSKIYINYYGLMNLIYSNLADCYTKEGKRKGIGHHNHDREFPEQAQSSNWFNKLVPNPCFWRVAKLGDNAYITHGDLGDYWNDDANWRFTKGIVRWAWVAYQKARNNPSETSPAHNEVLAGKLEISYILCAALLAERAILNHTHIAKIKGLYANLGSFTHRGVITYGLVENMRLRLMKTTKQETVCLNEVSL